MCLLSNASELKVIAQVKELDGITGHCYVTEGIPPEARRRELLLQRD